MKIFTAFTQLLLFLQIVAGLLLIFSSSAMDASAAAPKKPLTFRAIFGSCNKHDLDQSHWPHLMKKALSPSPKQEKLDAIVWGGDVVYQDYMPLPLWPYFVRVNDAEMERRWNFFKNRPEYKDAVARTKKIIGVTDDHENYNDCGKEAPTKDLTQKLLLDFLDVPKDVKNSKEAMVRRNKRKGVYAFHKFPLNNIMNENENKNAANVCFIMLDGRYHRDPPRADGRGEMLGEEQWKWLEQVLKLGRDPEIDDAGELINAVKTIDDVCVVTFIQSGIQVIADSQPMEHWAEFPEERNRLLRLLGASGSERFILLSGDVHYGEINRLSAMKIPAIEKNDRQEEREEEEPLYAKCGESPFPFSDLVEVTSSGMTHRVHPLFADAERYQRWFPSHRRSADGAYMKENAGIIQIDCRNPSDLRSCGIAVSIVALPNATVEVAKVEINFALEKATIMKRKLELPLAEQVMCNSMNSCADNVYRLPTYFSPWTKAIMWTKMNFPGGLLFEEGRLTIIFIHAWTIVLTLTFIFVLIVRCLCCGKSNNKKKHDNDNKKSKKE